MFLEIPVPAKVLGEQVARPSTRRQLRVERRPVRSPRASRKGQPRRKEHPGMASWSLRGQATKAAMPSPTASVTVPSTAIVRSRWNYWNIGTGGRFCRREYRWRTVMAPETDCGARPLVLYQSGVRVL